MIYSLPPPEAALDQGDVIDECPILTLAGFVPEQPDSAETQFASHRVLVLTQTCDLANAKTTFTTVAIVFDAVSLISQGLLKAADIRGPIRSGRVFGWYFLPANADLGLSEMVVDLHQIYTLPRKALEGLCQHGKRRARIQPLYREHLARHFAETYARIGLPEAYPTE